MWWCSTVVRHTSVHEHLLLLSDWTRLWVDRDVWRWNDTRMLVHHSCKCSAWLICADFSQLIWLYRHNNFSLVNFARNYVVFTAHLDWLLATTPTCDRIVICEHLPSILLAREWFKIVFFVLRNIVSYILACVADTDRTTGRVGAPLTCNEVMLVDWEEGMYRNLWHIQFMLTVHVASIQLTNFFCNVMNKLYVTSYKSECN